MHTPAALRWRPIVRRARRSGTSMREFAAQNGINPSTLAWWNWRLRDNLAESESAFVEVVVSREEVRPLRLHVGAVRLDVDADTDLGLLRRVIEALA